ncbi:unnamed protein product [Natator depressus]
MSQSESCLPRSSPRLLGEGVRARPLARRAPRPQLCQAPGRKCMGSCAVRLWRGVGGPAVPCASGEGSRCAVRLWRGLGGPAVPCASGGSPEMGADALCSLEGGSPRIGVGVALQCASGGRVPSDRGGELCMRLWRGVPRGGGAAVCPLEGGSPRSGLGAAGWGVLPARWNGGQDASQDPAAVSKAGAGESLGEKQGSGCGAGVTDMGGEEEEEEEEEFSPKAPATDKNCCCVCL